MVIELDDALNELVIANRILANENVVDAYGHVSIRHPRKPDRFFMAHMLATPEMVERSDIVEFGLDGEAVSDGRTPSVERFIHSGIYEARPDVVADAYGLAQGQHSLRIHYSSPGPRNPTSQINVNEVPS